MTREEVNNLVIENQKLVQFVISKYFPMYYKRIDKDLREDLIQEGMAYLVRAAEKFNPILGYKFSTYAVSYIWGRLGRYVDRQIKYLESSTYSLNHIVPGKEAEKDVEFIDTIEDSTARYENVELLNFISSLEIRDIEFIVEKLNKGYKQQEIARELNITQATLCMRLKKLRDLITEEYLAS